MSSASLIAKLEEAVKSGNAERRLDMLRQVTDLFLRESDRFSERQIAVFDDVLLHLIKRIETHALVQLSGSLAPVDKAPIEVVRQLSWHDEIAVAGPVLSQSGRLTDADLIAIAMSKGQGHLLAMSGRAKLEQSVTDVLIERGDSEVRHALAHNAGARFSQTGYATLVDKSEGDDALMEKLGVRLDMPADLLRTLLLRATDLVRSRLLAAAPPETQDKIQTALAGITSQLVREASGPRDFTNAEDMIESLNRRGKLNEAVLIEFLKDQKYEETVATLALFCSCNCELVERILKNVRVSGVIMLGRAANLGWPTVRLILEKRFAPHTPSEQELEGAKDAFMELSQPVAQRSLRFMMVQKTIKKSA